MGRLIDTCYQGYDRVIGTYEVDGLLVDPGPAVSIDAVLEQVPEPRGLLLTHIHLDHAGATGVLVRRFSELVVYVHERGAPHLIDPSKLLKSAGRLYGEDNMRSLWGEVAPVPEERLRILSGGETVEGFRVEYAPGHASHHVVYLHEESGAAYVGDVCGVRVPPSDFTIAPTPPPDIDVERWNATLDLLESWSPERVCLTHFGAVDDVPAQIGRVREWLARWGERAREASAEEFCREVVALEREEAGDEVAERLVKAAPPDQLYLGLERYWRKRAEREARAA